MQNIRNIAVIAHVDHGKTTMVDELLKQSGTFSEREQISERVMDSNDKQKHAIDHFKHALNLSAKISVSGRVDDIDFCAFIIYRGVL